MLVAVLVATDNGKYVKRGRGLMVRYDPVWEDELKETNPDGKRWSIEIISAFKRLFGKDLIHVPGKI